MRIKYDIDDIKLNGERVSASEVLVFDKVQYENYTDAQFDEIKKAWAEKVAAYNWLCKYGKYFDIFKTNLVKMISVESIVDDVMPEKVVLDVSERARFDKDVKYIIKNMRCEIVDDEYGKPNDEIIAMLTEDEKALLGY